MLHENFEFTLNEIGEPKNCVKLSAEQLMFAKEHLPESYVEFLQKYGYGHFFDGGWQIVDPLEYKPLAELIFKNDKDFSPETTHIVGYSAFGNTLSAWSEKYRATEINLLDYTVANEKIAPSDLGGLLEEFAEEFLEEPLENLQPKDANHNSAARLIPDEESDIDCYDFDGELMFQRCVEKYGALEQGECYGFFPSLGMFSNGNQMKKVANIKRVKAYEHFSFIAQLKDFYLDQFYDGRANFVRYLGYTDDSTQN